MVRPVTRYVQVSSDSIFNLFDKMKWDQQSIAWEQEADLRKVLQYARGSKLLRLPEGWREIIPKEIWYKWAWYPQNMHHGYVLNLKIKEHRLESIHGAAWFGLNCTAQSCGLLGSLQWNRDTRLLPSSASMFVNCDWVLIIDGDQNQRWWSSILVEHCLPFIILYIFTFITNCGSSYVGGLPR